MQYFQDISSSSGVSRISTASFVAPVIQPDDILTITVITTDPTATLSINAGNMPVQGTGVSLQQTVVDQMVTGYLVDKEGYVQIPIIGKFHLSGLSTMEARELITQKATVLFNNPTVVVRNKNFKITVLGEVGRPGTYLLPNERVTVLDAIGLAGDLTIYGKRNNVLLLRRLDDGTLNTIRINLNNSEILKSTYYYVKQNDVIYIEPSKQKIASGNVTFTRNIAVATSVLTTIILLFQVFKN